MFTRIKGLSRVATVSGLVTISVPKSHRRRARTLALSLVLSTTQPSPRHSRVHSPNPTEFKTDARARSGAARSDPGSAAGGRILKNDKTRILNHETTQRDSRPQKERLERICLEQKSSMSRHLRLVFFQRPTYAGVRCASGAASGPAWPGASMPGVRRAWFGASRAGPVATRRVVARVDSVETRYNGRDATGRGQRADVGARREAHGATTETCRTYTIISHTRGASRLFGGKRYFFPRLWRAHHANSHKSRAPFLFTQIKSGASRTLGFILFFSRRFRFQRTSRYGALEKLSRAEGFRDTLFRANEADRHISSEHAPDRTSQALETRSHKTFSDVSSSSPNRDRATGKRMKLLASAGKQAGHIVDRLHRRWHAFSGGHGRGLPEGSQHSTNSPTQGFRGFKNSQWDLYPKTRSENRHRRSKTLAGPTVLTHC